MIRLSMPVSSAEAGVGGIMMACSGGEALGATFIPTFSELAVFTKQPSSRIAFVADKGQ